MSTPRNLIIGLLAILGLTAFTGCTSTCTNQPGARCELLWQR